MKESREWRSSCILGLALLASSCHNGTEPSAVPVPRRPDLLMITPAIDALKLGSAETLTAAVLSGDGTERTVAASWSSDGPNVVAVSDDGRVRGVGLGKTT